MYRSRSPQDLAPPTLLRHGPSSNTNSMANPAFHQAQYQSWNAPSPQIVIPPAPAQASYFGAWTSALGPTNQVVAQGSTIRPGYDWAMSQPVPPHYPMAQRSYVPPTSSTSPYYGNLAGNEQRPAYQYQSPPTQLPPGPIVTGKKCGLCLEVYEIREIEKQFPHKCTKCSVSYCKSCIKEWFVDACKNESKMPPKCCTIIPLFVINDLLNKDQSDLYKAKFEEWCTPDRLYCPVPQCSAFISARDYLISHRDLPDLNLSSFPGIPADYSVKQDSPKGNSKKPHVPCPKCGISVCTKCRGISHIGDCPDTDLDPILEGKLKKWRIKRCPKCRTGVRKIYGCSHVECRCGAHFCFECLQPIGMCDGNECQDSDDDRVSNYSEDDLDGNAGYFEDDGHDFGEEPTTGNEIWGCHHNWQVFEFNPSLPRPIGDLSLECNICFGAARPESVPGLSFSPVPRTVKTQEPNTDVVMSGTEYPTNIYGQPAWSCLSRHMYCTRCHRVPTKFRANDPSFLWQCNYGTVCKQCNTIETVAKHKRDVEAKRLQDAEQLSREREEEAKVAWECGHCGMIICGDCKRREG